MLFSVSVCYSMNSYGFILQKVTILSNFIARPKCRVCLIYIGMFVCILAGFLKTNRRILLKYRGKRRNHNRRNPLTIGTNQDHIVALKSFESGLVCVQGCIQADIMGRSKMHGFIMERY